MWLEADPYGEASGPEKTPRREGFQGAGMFLCPPSRRCGCPTCGLFSWHKSVSAVLKTENKNPDTASSALLRRPWGCDQRARSSQGGCDGLKLCPRGSVTQAAPPAWAAPVRRSARRVWAAFGPVLETLLKQ